MTSGTGAGATAAPPVIQLRGLALFRGALPVLEDVSLEVRAGEFLAIVGPNGSGKTSLLKIILGLLAPTAGEVRVLGRSAREARAAIGYCPQHAAFPKRFPVDVRQVVLSGRMRPGLGPVWYGAADREAAREAMALCEVSGLSGRALSTLSGGQLQRVLLARALAGAPELLLLDEPTASADPRMEQALYDLLQRLNSRMTILVVSHDIAFVSRYVTRVACVNRNLVCHRPEHLNAELIERLYRAHVHAVPHEAGEHRARARSPGAGADAG